MIFDCVNNSERISKANKIIYISGAITGTDDYLKRFDVAENILRGEGYQKIINPAAVMDRLPKLTHEQYMLLAMSMLDMSDEIYLLKGWHTSSGSLQEVLFAEYKGILIRKE